MDGTAHAVRTALHTEQELQEAAAAQSEAQARALQLERAVQCLRKRLARRTQQLQEQLSRQQQQQLHLVPLALPGHCQMYSAIMQEGEPQRPATAPMIGQE